MKPGSIAFTVDQQPTAALEVLKQRASEKKVRLSLWGDEVTTIFS
jgi:folylpolyglutamate synthase/dihydropteroate synthase